MRIAYTFEGKDAVFERDVTEVVVGRPKAGVRVDLELARPEGLAATRAGLAGVPGQEHGGASLRPNA